MSRLVGPVVVAVLREALEKFGPITPDNRDLVRRWVQRLVRELQQGEPVDTKAKAAGESD